MEDSQLSFLGEITPRIAKKSLKKVPKVKMMEDVSAIPVEAPPSPPQKPKITKQDLPLEKIYKKLVSGIQTFFRENNFKQGVLGVSGGVDSALTLKLAVDAAGPENIFALILPELGVTSQENIDHAKTLCSFLKVPFFYLPINSFLTDFAMLPWKPGKIASMNIRARIRMNLLYHFANTHTAVVLGTSNRSELLLGYGTKYGDLACDMEVIGDLYKTEVIALADFIGLPPEIVHKTPSAELTPGQTDEAELGASYHELDQVLMKLDLGIDGAIDHGLPATLVHDVFRRVSQNAHKTKLPPVIPVR